VAGHVVVVLGQQPRGCVPLLPLERATLAWLDEAAIFQLTKCGHGLVPILRRAAARRTDRYSSPLPPS
jgi:hypothetical protein